MIAFVCHGHLTISSPDDNTHLYTVTGSRISLVLLPEQNNIDAGLPIHAEVACMRVSVVNPSNTTRSQAC